MAVRHCNSTTVVIVHSTLPLNRTPKTRQSLRMYHHACDYGGRNILVTLSLVEGTLFPLECNQAYEKAIDLQVQEMGCRHRWLLPPRLICMGASSIGVINST